MPTELGSLLGSAVAAVKDWTSRLADLDEAKGDDDEEFELPSALSALFEFEKYCRESASVQRRTSRLKFATCCQVWISSATFSRRVPGPFQAVAPKKKERAPQNKNKNHLQHTEIFFEVEAQAARLLRLSHVFR